MSLFGVWLNDSDGRTKMDGTDGRKTKITKRATYQAPPAPKVEEPKSFSYRGVAPVSEPPKEEPMTEADRELARYLNRDVWEERSKAATSDTTQPTGKTGILRYSPTPSAPAPEAVVNGIAKEEDRAPTPSEMADDTKEFAKGLRTEIGIFVNRMKSNQARGRPIMNDSTIQQMFFSITQRHSELMKHLNTLDEKRGYYESLNDKVEQIRDAREAITALRQEHAYKQQMEMQERQRQRQIQMGQKLGYMRQQKQEYLERMRQQAIEQMKQQEQEMLMKKQMAYQGYVPQGPMPGPYDMGQMGAALPPQGAYQPPTMYTAVPQPHMATIQTQAAYQQQMGYAPYPGQYQPPPSQNYGYQQGAQAQPAYAPPAPNFHQPSQNQQAPYQATPPPGNQQANSYPQQDRNAAGGYPAYYPPQTQMQGYPGGPDPNQPPVMAQAQGYQNPAQMHGDANQSMTPAQGYNPQQVQVYHGGGALMVSGQIQGQAPQEQQPASQYAPVPQGQPPAQPQSPEQAQLISFD